MIFVDVESVGLCGPIVLIQYAIDDGPIQLHNVWLRPIKETQELINTILSDDYVGFNLAFDFFKLCQLGTTLDLFPDKNVRPIDLSEQYFELEPFARDGKCYKPKAALDLMLFCRKGPYQSVMPRGDIRIKRIPNSIVRMVSEELNKRIPLKPIYFAKRKKELDNPWQIFPTKDDDFKDIVLKFAPSSALKALAADALGIDEEKILLLSDLAPLPYPREYGFAPYGKATEIALSKNDEKKATWLDLLELHINHWEYNQKARQYASDDVDYTRRLYAHFGSPAVGDDDSELACMVAAARWKGFKINIPGIKKLRKKAIAKTKINGVKIPTYAGDVKKLLEEVMSEEEKVFMGGSTKKVILEKLAKGKLWNQIPCECEISLLTDGDIKIVKEECPKCKGKGTYRHPVSERAEQVLEARKAKWEIDLYNKLLHAGRFHASFAVIGTLSSRMGGGGSATGIEYGGKAKGDRLNPQGVKRTEEVRKEFPLSFGPLILCGGDFNAFEISLIQAVYKDPWLEETLRANKSPIIYFGMDCFPGSTYEEIKKSKSQEGDMYDPAKRGFYAFAYGGNAKTIQERVGIAEEAAIEAERKFLLKAKGMKERRDQIAMFFGAMRQPNGIGSRVEWHGSREYMESPLGFKRYFTLENQIRKALFELAEKPPKEWAKIKIKVKRKDREQWVQGAARSAIFAAAFAIQGDVTRAGINHEIQSFGAEITKRIQRKIWDVQPSGIHDWIVQPMNVHDEILCPTHPNYTDKVKEIVDNEVEKLRPLVPLISLDWKTNINNWAEK